MCAKRQWYFFRQRSNIATSKRQKGGDPQKFKILTLAYRSVPKQFFMIHRYLNIFKQILTNYIWMNAKFWGLSWFPICLRNWCSGREKICRTCTFWAGSTFLLNATCNTNKKTYTLFFIRKAVLRNLAILGSLRNFGAMWGRKMFSYKKHVCMQTLHGYYGNMLVPNASS